MRLLFVGTNPENTGAATHFVTLAKAMVEAGHEVEAIVSRKGLIGERLAAAGVPTFASSFRNVHDLRGYSMVMRRIAAFSPDWLVGNFGKEYWPLIASGRLTNTPVALFRHRNPRMSKLSEWGVPRFANRFIAVSEFARNAYLRWGVSADRVWISYNPVDVNEFQPDPQRRAQVRREFGIADDDIVMGFVGRMHGGKGVAQLMQAANEAMRTNPRLHALWVGNGPEESALHRMADQGGFSTRHHFTGWVADTARYHRAFSFLAFPSVELETFGRVSIEAQACGVPVLGSHIGGVPETLRDGVTGFLIKPGDIAAWRDRILALCDETLCAEMGIAARAHVVDYFSNAAVARDFELLLRYGDEVLHHYEHAPT